jgi:hypothetical protein
MARRGGLCGAADAGHDSGSSGAPLSPGLSLEQLTTHASRRHDLGQHPPAERSRDDASAGRLRGLASGSRRSADIKPNKTDADYRGCGQNCRTSVRGAPVLGQAGSRWIP